MNNLKKLTHLFLIVLITLFLSAGKVTAVEISITDNGSGSTSEANVSESTHTTVEQTNNATVENNVTSESNSGNNEANANSGGQTTIESGAVENKVEVTNVVNNSTVSGDCCPTPNSSASPDSVTITGNGSGSTNAANVSMSTTTTVTVNNNSVVTNTINGTANSGGNKANNNNGDVTINTGKVSVTETIVNAVNNADVKVSTQQNGILNAKIAGNDTLSVNTLNTINRNTTTVAINQNADILNISNWFANSGNNTASENVGDVTITTGDVTIATLIKNIVNMAKVDITCCQPQTPPCEYNCNPTPPCETDCNPSNPPSNPSTPSNGGGGNGGGGNGGGGSAGGPGGGSVLGITSGDILPSTGSSWTLWLTILAGLLFALGFYLRMHPGRAPNAKFAF